MHVLFLAEDYTPLGQAQGGVLVSVARQVEGLAGSGDRVTVVSPRRIFPPLGRYRQTGVPLVPPGTAGEGAAAPPAAVRVIRPRILHLPLLWPLTEPLQILVAGARALRGPARGADLLHAHRSFPMGIVAVLLGRISRRPSVVTAYGSDVNADTRSPNLVFRALARAGLGAMRLIAVSEALAARAITLGVDPGRVRFVPSGVDLGRFSPADRAAARRELGLPADRFIFLSMNHFFTVKGHAILIDAMADLTRRRPGQAYLALTGGGPEFSRTVEHAGALGITDDVRFAGLRPYDELPVWVNAADALVLPSLSEGMPLTVLEGFACGKPLVGSRVGGVPEVVPDERYGLLVPPGDRGALAAALAAAMDRSWDAAALRARAQMFAWPAVIQQIRAVYAELVPG